MSHSVTIVLPVLNEESVLPKLFKELERIALEIDKNNVELHFFFSDNNSTDSTWELVSSWVTSQKNARAVRLLRNYGYQNSLLNAFGLIETDALIVYQSDMQDPIDLLPLFIQEWTNGKKSVAGQITKRNESFVDRFSRHAFYGLLNWVSDSNHPNGLQDFYLVDRAIYQDISESPRQFQFLRSKIASNYGFDLVIPYERQARMMGETKFDFTSKLNLAIDGLLSNSVNLRRKIVGFALVCGTLSFIGSLALLFAFIFGWRTILGWTSLALFQLFGITVLSSGFAVIIEILGRLYNLEVNPVRIRVERQSEHIVSDFQVKGGDHD